MVRSALFLPAAAAAMLALLPVSAPAQSGFQTDQRLNAMQDQMRDLTGRIEELTNEVNQLHAQLDRQASDTDVRFRQLQGGGSTTSLAPPGPPDTAPTELSAQPKSPPGGGADFSQPASRSGNLGSLPAPGPGRRSPPEEPPPPQPAAAGGALPPGNAQDQYNYAMGLLTQANYPAAEQAMRAFVQRYPKDPLAGNAQYWLGETFYVRNDYGNAATAFAQAYEKYPKSPKAADDLLKLGMSLTALNQRADACKAYARLQRDFPAPPQSIRERLSAEKQRAGCAG